jgi:hypothetical protein
MGFAWGMLAGPLAAYAVVVVEHNAARPEYVQAPENFGLLLLMFAWGGGVLAALAARAAFPHLRRFLHPDSLSRASFVWPAIAVAFVGPISIHAAVAGPMALFGTNTDPWFAFAYAGTVHVHAAFAIAMGIAAWRLAGGNERVRVALWPAVALAFFPGIFLLFPPLLVWMCGLMVAHSFLAVARGWLAAERAA